MFKLAVFDMDGTLLDSLSDIAAACNYALQKSGFCGHALNDYKEFVGRGPMYLVTRALPEQNRDDVTVSKTRAFYDEYYSEHSEDFTRPYPGVEEMLKRIVSRGVKTAVFSNKPHDYAVKFSEVYFPGLIDMPVGLDYGVPAKPDPTVGFRIMESFGFTSNETVYIGDSGVDMQTGKRLGVYTVGVSWGFRPKRELWDNGADVIVDKADELVKIIVDN